MEGLENSVSPAAAPAPAPAASPAPTPAPAPVAAAPMPNPSPEIGGNGSDSFMDTLKSLNWTEVVIGALAVGALFSVIYYYRYNLKFKKSFANELQNKVDEITMKVSDISSALDKDKVNATQSFDGFF
jgi:hypothetical protein